MALKIDTKFEGKLICASKNDTRNLANFHQSTFEGLKIWTFSRKCMSLRFAGELCVQTMKNDAKFQEDLTCQFKIDIRSLTNFEPSTQKSQKCAL